MILTAYLGELQIVDLLLCLGIIDHLGQHQHKEQRQDHHQDHGAEQEVGDLCGSRAKVSFVILPLVAI